MPRKPTTSNITRGGAIHINNGEGGPLCGTYDRNGSRNMPWKADRRHATCRRCMSMQRDIDAYAAVLGTADLPQQTRRRVGVVGQGANGAPRKKQLTTGFVLPDNVIDGELVKADIVEEIPAADAAPALTATPEPKEQTEMTTQQPAETADQVAAATPASTPAADVRPANTTNPLILDLGDLIPVEKTNPRFRVVFTAKDQSKVGCESCGGHREPELVVVAEGADRQTGLIKAIKGLTFVITEEVQESWMGGGEG